MTFILFRSDIPHLRGLLHSIHDCEYALFFREMLAIQPAIAGDRYCSAHTQFFMREFTLLAFNQYLEPYKRYVEDCFGFMVLF